MGVSCAVVHGVTRGRHALVMEQQQTIPEIATLVNKPDNVFKKLYSEITAIQV